ncbi:MAG TPA: xanthine dehydrogenase accessory protein XdhC [Nocardioides sp.]|nr:xanthine dehydrogenase accessory protein XdhC [Nocardioides sp.]
MRWLQAVERLRTERRPGVLVTLVMVRGHAPREAGAKMVVVDDATWDSIGGGNVEATAVSRARALLASGDSTPTTFTVDLSDKAPVEHGVQCCGGEVSVLLEPLAVRPAVAVFGIGHVGLELARILARHDLDLHLVDSRPGQLGDDVLTPLADADARVHVHHEAVLPELVLAELPAGTHVLVMTHDHAEDVALLDAALRAGHLGPVGVIGSSAKWARFRKTLLADGHDPAAVDSIVTPIGLPSLAGKDPATIAVSVAAALLQSFADESAAVRSGRASP